MPGRCDRLAGARIRGRGHFHTDEDQRIFFSFAKIEEIKQRHGYLFSLQSRGVFRTPSAGSSSFSIRDEILTREGSFASFGIIYLSRITTLGYPTTFGQKSELALGKAFGRCLSTRPRHRWRGKRQLRRSHRAPSPERSGHQTSTRQKNR